MRELNDFLSMVDAHFGGSQWFVYLLLGTGLFYTIYLGFPQIRFFRHAIDVVSGKYDHARHVGDTSHFQALATALSGTVGTGNIAGVALAIHLGGPSAVFWMLVTAALGMTTKMVEVTLSHKYREQLPDGTISGGPMYYMKRRLHLSWLAGLFAFATILSSFGTGSLPQINSISNAMFSSFGISHYITGLVLAVILALIIIGGIKRIAQVTEKLTPFMAIVYVLGSLSVLIYNYDQVWPAVVAIFGGVFSGTAATGGFLGATVALAFNRGVNRGLFSNEAGQGSAPIAHAAAKAEDPVSEGMVALLEPFIDTIVICALTGLVLVSSGVWHEKYQNQFQGADLVVLAGDYAESDAADRAEVGAHLLGEKTLPLFSPFVRRGRSGQAGRTALYRDIACRSGQGAFPASRRQGGLYGGTVAPAFGAALHGGLQTRDSGGLGTICHSGLVVAFRLFHHDRLGLLREPGHYLSLGRTLCALLSGDLCRRLFPRFLYGHDDRLDPLRNHGRLDDLAQPDRHPVTAQGGEGLRARLCKKNETGGMGFVRGKVLFSRPDKKGEAHLLYE